MILCWPRGCLSLAGAPIWGPGLSVVGSAVDGVGLAARLGYRKGSEAAAAH